MVDFGTAGHVRLELGGVEGRPAPGRALGGDDRPGRAGPVPRARGEAARPPRRRGRVGAQDAGRRRVPRARGRGAPAGRVGRPHVWGRSPGLVLEVRASVGGRARVGRQFRHDADERREASQRVQIRGAFFREQGGAQRRAAVGGALADLCQNPSETCFMDMWSKCFGGAAQNG